MIRIDALWLCTQSQDMRAGADRLLSVVVNTVGKAQAHHGYLFANARASRIKLLVHDGFGVVRHPTLAHRPVCLGATPGCIGTCTATEPPAV
ncbi:MAG: IS66 family insertion sequence element accessory protein TnpB [Burkholderiales bacterium]|nr:IS66 family insertion sequence element accessory protein TnpB [Burkholderiales bacterium]